MLKPVAMWTLFLFFLALSGGLMSGRIARTPGTGGYSPSSRSQPLVRTGTSNANPQASRLRSSEAMTDRPQNPSAYQGGWERAAKPQVQSAE